MLDAGYNENIASHFLTDVVDWWCKDHNGIEGGVYHVKRVKLWSKAAKERFASNGGSTTGLRVEHGTPRRYLGRLVYNIWLDGKLTKGVMDEIAATRWKVAVVTVEEDQRLKRSGECETPTQRWEEAGIEFENKGPLPNKDENRRTPITETAAGESVKRFPHLMS